jgi:hypothetical protein
MRWSSSTLIGNYLALSKLTENIIEQQNFSKSCTVPVSSKYDLFPEK